MSAIRRVVLSLLMPATLGILTAGPAVAQSNAGQSTWDRIMETKTLRLGVAVGEPWSLRDPLNGDAPGSVKAGNDTWRGIAPLLGKSLADTLGVNLQIVETTWPNSVAGLQARQFDIWFVMEPTPKRAMAIDFVPTTLLWHAMAYYATKPVGAKTWAELDDPKYRVGVVIGVATDLFATKYLPKAKITRLQDIDQQIAALQAGRIDAAIMLSPVATTAYAKLKTGGVVIPTPVKAYPSSASVPREADPRWKNFVTAAVQYYYNTGEIQDLYDLHLKYRGLDPTTVPSILRERW